MLVASSSYLVNRARNTITSSPCMTSSNLDGERTRDLPLGHQTSLSGLLYVARTAQCTARDPLLIPSLPRAPESRDKGRDGSNSFRLLCAHEQRPPFSAGNNLPKNLHFCGEAPRRKYIHIGSNVWGTVDLCWYIIQSVACFEQTDHRYGLFSQSCFGT